VRLRSLATAFALCACAARGEREATPGSASTLGPTVPALTVAPSPALPAPGASANNKAKHDADAVVAEALELVARVRQLSAKNPVPGLRMQRAELHAEMQRLLVEETPKEALLGNAELLFALDTVAADFDLESTIAKLYAAELAGFYDPKAKHMVLATDLGRDAETVTLYHELVHALQDQHFDLGRSFTFRPEESDVQGALHSLAEGDATSAMTEIFAASRGVAATEIPSSALRLQAVVLQAAPDSAQVPGIIARSMIAPYADGLDFVRYLREHQGGFAAVNRAFEAPPISTEQILHPQKYLTHEPVEPLPAPTSPPGFSGGVFRDVMGEQGLRLLFEEWAPASDAALAASDWGGDRVAVFSQGDMRVVRWHLVFDTDVAARRALTLLARGALRPELSAGASAATTPTTPKSGDPRLRPFVARGEAEAAIHGGRLCRPRAERGSFAIVRRGRHVGVTLGPYLRGATPVRPSDTCPQALGWAELVASEH
jgi:hypothetical protein